jgi:hypothetical protein
MEGRCGYRPFFMINRIDWGKNEGSIRSLHLFLYLHRNYDHEKSIRILQLRSKNTFEEIEIYNMNGQLMYSKYGMDNNELSIVLTDNFNSGIYIIRINRTTTLKWIKK